MGCCNFRINSLTVAMLVVMRLALGWHLLYVGLDKLNGDFSSAPFLSQAKGPYAQYFRDMVPDYRGTEAFDLKKQAERIDRYVARQAAFYHYSDAQQAEVAKIADQWKDDFDKWFKDHATQLRDLDADWGRLDLAEAANPNNSEPFGAEQIWEKRNKARGDTVKLQDELAEIDPQYEADLQRLLTPEQAKRGDVPLSLAERFTIDNIVMYSNIAIGACLILGLFTRLAALGGGLFMVPIVLSQFAWPGTYPLPHPSAGPALLVTKDAIYMLSLFLLATTHVGRWGGLDFFIHHLFVRPVFCRKSREASK